MKMSLLAVCLIGTGFFALSAASRAAPFGSGFHVRSVQNGRMGGSAGGGHRPFIGRELTKSGVFGVFDKLVLVSWLNDARKDVIYVKNTETNDVERMTSEPNNDQFRIVAIHSDPDPNLFEAVISGGGIAAMLRDGKLSMVVLMIDNPPGQNAGYYRILPLDKDPQRDGQWDVQTFHSGVVAVHAALLPNGKVLAGRSITFRGRHAGL